jgi:hypothetical protein
MLSRMDIFDSRLLGLPETVILGSGADQAHDRDSFDSGYWAYDGGHYGWHGGYWGPHVGFYGVNYGFGYFGSGFHGGRWRVTSL